jgi:hypothetical protein
MHNSLDPDRKAMIREAIAVYATEVAGTRDDLDDSLETAALEVWQDLD